MASSFGSRHGGRNGSEYSTVRNFRRIFSSTELTRGCAIPQYAHEVMGVVFIKDACIFCRSVVLYDAVYPDVSR